MSRKAFFSCDGNSLSGEKSVCIFLPEQHFSRAVCQEKSYLRPNDISGGVISLHISSNKISCFPSDRIFVGNTSNKKTPSIKHASSSCKAAHVWSVAAHPTLRQHIQLRFMPHARIHKRLRHTFVTYMQHSDTDSTRLSQTTNNTVQRRLFRTRMYDSKCDAGYRSHLGVKPSKLLQGHSSRFQDIYSSRKAVEKPSLLGFFL